MLNIVSAHVSATVPNVAILESGRGMIGQWNRAGMMEQAIRVDGGFMRLPEGTGLWNRLSAEFLDRADILRSIIRA